ncbi:unnamed protein product [Adineta ricciae]|uniref:C2H2-type domain-containing protein n=2 Tax=Adineta ricciae TaxID=249248 RepID=A0A815TCK0_ADIRI|nr:unnamed protein product [Adineta ricciae]
MASFTCPLCSPYRDFNTLTKIFKHITLYHQNDPNFGIVCDLRNTCGVLYRSYSAYKSHIYRQHLDELQSVEMSDSRINAIPVDNRQQHDTDFDVGHAGINDNDHESILLNVDYEETFLEEALSSPTSGMESFDSIVDIRKTYLSFLLQLREEFLLPKNVMHTISSYIVTLLNHTQSLLGNKTISCSAHICSCLSSTSCKVKDKEIIEFDEVKHTLNDVCIAIESINKNEYQLIKYCEEYFGYSVPEEIVVSLPGENLDRGYFIPVDKTLTSMFSSHSFVAQILENIQRQQTLAENDPDLMFSIRDAYNGGRIDHDSILLQVYMDDIGLTNPIGSKRDHHKLSMVYFSIEDVPDQYRSKIDNIQLLAICDSKILKDCDKAKRFFQPIVDNLNWIQFHGLSINGVHLKFSFSTVVSDNLAAHMIGGFQSCFSAGYFCRRCYIPYTEKNSLTAMSTTKRRTTIDHDELVQELLVNPNKSPLMGVIGSSPLCELIGFHPTHSLPGDIMHDFLEGVCPMVIMCLLKQASSMRLITYGESS